MDGIKLQQTETPRQALERLYTKVKYGLTVRLKGCRGGDGFICPIVSSLSWQDSYQVVKMICEEIINETLSEYTNDENHERVEFWKQVLTELKEKRE